MAIVLTEQHLPRLLATLQNIQRAYQIRGEICSKLQSVITDYDFIVDRWPDYRALVVRVDPTTAKHPVHLGNRIHVYTTDRDALEVMLQQPGVIQWSEKSVFLCFGADVLSTVVDVICQNDRTYDVDPYIVMKVTMDTLKLRNIPEGYTMTNLHPEDAHHVNTSWSYNDGRHSEIYIEELISKQPSRCLYNEKGSLVGYALRLHNGNIGFLHVLDEHRGKGYAKVIMSHLASLCLQQMEELKYLRPIVDLYATYVDALRDLLEQLEKRFECADSTLTPVLTEVAQLHRTLTREIYDCVYLIVTQDTLKLRPVPEGCVMSNLEADHTALVDSTWDLRNGDVSKDYIRHLITTLPSTCLYNQEGEVMGYALTYHYGCLGVLYVPQNHRGKGYGKVAMSHLVQKHLEKRKEVLVMIQRENIPSIKMHEGIGFQVIPDMRYDWIFCE